MKHLRRADKNTEQTPAVSTRQHLNPFSQPSSPPLPPPPSPDRHTHMRSILRASLQDQLKPWHVCQRQEWDGRVSSECEVGYGAAWAGYKMYVRGKREREKEAGGNVISPAPREGREREGREAVSPALHFFCLTSSQSQRIDQECSL